MSGKLYIVGTPIGNLEDMTFRAVRILGEVDKIAAEDTRQTIKLLNHFEIKTPLAAYHKFNEQAASEKLVAELKTGVNLALVSDAGMPLISDPGYILVKTCREEGIPMEVIPGPNAALCALVLSGLDTRRFRFLGFLGKSAKEIKAGLREISESQETMVLYESPHRLLKTLAKLAEALPERLMSISREITKRYEETRTGTAAELLAWFTEHPPKGEFVLVIAGGEEISEDFSKLSLADHLARYTAEGLDEKAAMKAVAGDRGIAKRDVYNALKR